MEKSGIPRDSIIHRVEWDYIACSSQLRKLFLCCENHIDPVFCKTEQNYYTLCERETASRA